MYICYFVIYYVEINQPIRICNPFSVSSGWGGGDMSDATFIHLFVCLQAALMLCYHSIEPWLFILLYCIVSAVNELEVVDCTHGFIS